MNYIWHILVLFSLYALAALSLNLIVGYCGLLSLSHAAFYGVGAYAVALLTTKASWGFFPAAAAGVLASALLSAAVAVPSLRLRGDYYILGTLGFQIIIFSVLNNWVDLTGGGYGIPGVPVPRIVGNPINTPLTYFLFSAAVVTVCSLLLWRLLASPFGRVLRALREDEVAAEALGRNVTALKVTAFVLGACFAAVAGALLAGYARYVDPTSFNVAESIYLLCIVIIGGAGSFWGPIAGALIMVVLPEAFRFLHLPPVVAANLRQILFGAALVLLMRLRPQGLLGEYDFD